jgi:RND family efflux transporter MFP subunit
MADFSSLEFEVDVFERDIRLILEGMPCRVVLDAFPSEPMAGKVRRVEPTADRQNATVEVKISFDEPHPRMVPEMGGRAVFLKQGGEKAAREPERVFVKAAAVVSREGKKGVFVVEGGTAKFVRVETGTEQGGEVQVLSGLRGGERVVLRPPEALADGQKVEV